MGDWQAMQFTVFFQETNRIEELLIILNRRINPDWIEETTAGSWIGTSSTVAKFNSTSFHNTRLCSLQFVLLSGCFLQTEQNEARGSSWTNSANDRRTRTYDSPPVTCLSKFARDATSRPRQVSRIKLSSCVRQQLSSALIFWDMFWPCCCNVVIHLQRARLNAIPLNVTQ